MFVGFIGQPTDFAQWRSLLARHTAWLQMEHIDRSWSMRDGSTLACAWLRKPNSGHLPCLEESESWIKMRTWVAPPVQGTGGQTEQWSGDKNSATVIAIPRDNMARIEVPLTTPEQIYYAPCRDGGAVFGNDMRFLLRWAGMRLDERALYSLMMCGTIVPPYTIAAGVRRIPNGHALALGTGKVAPQLELMPDAVIKNWHTAPVSDPARAVRDTLDSILGNTPTGSAVYFSGGVDSGLMAARLAALGRRDVRLINFSFGPDDAEGQLARAMAQRLGLRLEQVMYDPNDVMGVLDRLAIDYPLPFGDYSVLPMNMLVRASLTSSAGAPSCAVEGAAADDLFSVGVKYRQWKRWYRVPSPIRGSMGAAYAGLRLSESDSRAGRAGRVARRSVLMPLEGAGIFVQNSLAGIAYHPSRKVIQAISTAIQSSYGPLTEGIAPEDRFSILFALHDVVGRVAHKSYMLLRAYGARPLFPFLEPTMIQLSASLRWDQKVRDGVTKAPLKELLAQQVGEEMVYRKKSGFIPPFEAMLTTRPMYDYLHDVALSPHNPLAQHLDTPAVQRLIDRAYSGQALNLESYFFLWAVVFGSAWLYRLMTT